jgi:hypothetical protein
MSRCLPQPPLAKWLSREELLRSFPTTLKQIALLGEGGGGEEGGLGAAGLP